MDSEELYCFDGLKSFLNQNGVKVKEPYMPVDPNDVEWYAGGKHIRFEKDGIYLIKRNGGLQKVFLYRKDYFRQKPTFHIFCCHNVQKKYIGSMYRCANTGSVPVIQDKKENRFLSELPICGYCAEMAHLDKKYNSSSYINLLLRGQSIVDVHTNENLSVYSNDWQDVKESYFRRIKYRCESCGVVVSDVLKRDMFLKVIHRNHIYNDDSIGNLRCLCLDCLSKRELRSVWVNGANKLTLDSFRKSEMSEI